MAHDIVINGIETNNLKGISVKLKKNAINLIVGPSGSGKSSLAYDTIAQIGLHELGAMYYDGINEPQYAVESYSNMVVTIPIKQLNNNNNVRSTIGTYFSLNPCLAKIYASILELPYDYFVLNKTENICPKCMGVGYTKQLDPVKVVDYDKTLEQVPIRCWNRNKDFYRKAIELFCDERGISTGKKFRQLSAKDRHAILYGESKGKFTIKYKVTNHFSTRTTPYYGVMTEQPMLKNFSPSKDFFSELSCDLCGGEKYEKKHRDYKICGYSIGEVMVLPFDKIEKWIADIRNKYDCTNIEFSLAQVEIFSRKASELNLGYLFLNRNIPSLSGGELQRLRLIKVFASQLSDLLIVLDEPLAGLSAKEKKLVYNNIKALSKKHTLLIVDHHSMFVNDAENIIALGEGSGVNGGNLINAKKYLSRQGMKFNIVVLPEDQTETVQINSSVYSYQGVEIQIALNRLNVVTGASGVGKSTLLREYLTQYFDNYIYINQKPLGGNNHSTVATDLGIANKITILFSKTFKKEKSMFSNMPSANGACRVCGGTGFITYGSESQSQIAMKCKDCRGTGFDKKLMKYSINDKSIQDIMEMTIDEAVEYFEEIDTSIAKMMYEAQGLLLGHLKLSEKTSCLSGGENLRVKLIKSIGSNSKVLGIDEPFKGLNAEEIYKIIIMLKGLVDQGKTIIVVDHEENCFKYFTRRIDLKNKNGILCE